MARTIEKKFTIDDALNALFKTYKVSEEVQRNVLAYIEERKNSGGTQPYQQFTNSRFLIRGIKPILGWYSKYPDRKYGNSIYIELDWRRRKSFTHQVYNQEVYTFDRKNGHIFAYINEYPDEEITPPVKPADIHAAMPVVEVVAKPTFRDRVRNLFSVLSGNRKS